MSYSTDTRGQFGQGLSTFLLNVSKKNGGFHFMLEKWYNIFFQREKLNMKVYMKVG